MRAVGCTLTGGEAEEVLIATWERFRKPLVRASDYHVTQQSLLATPLLAFLPVLTPTHDHHLYMTPPVHEQNTSADQNGRTTSIHP